MIVPLPEMIQDTVAPGGTLTVKMLPVAPVQRVVGPVIVQGWAGTTVTVLVQVAVQPLAATVVVSVNDPAAPAVTLMVVPVDDPTIVPFPEMTVEYVAPGIVPLVMVKMLPVELGQTEFGPLIVQVGCGFTVTVRVQVEMQPWLFTVAVSVNDPEAPAVTLTELPVVEPMIVPLPEMIQVTLEPGGLLTVKKFPVELGQTELTPVIWQGWAGTTVTVLVQVAVQPLAATVVVSVNDPAAPAVTLMVVPVDGPTIVPLPEMTVE
jgi:hypothetical protein